METQIVDRRDLKMNQVETFTNELFGQVRALEIEGKPYAVASDIAKALGYKNANDAIIRHCKGIVKHDMVDRNGFTQIMNVIPEGDIYRLIIKSKLSSAEKFEKWVMEDVLPSLRSNGSYSLQGLSKELQAIFTIDKKTVEMDNRLSKLENTMTIDYSQQEELRMTANRTVVELLDGKSSEAYKKLKNRMFQDLWRSYKKYFRVNSYRNTAVKDFEDAINYIENWSPDEVILFAINGLNRQASFA